MAHGKNNLKNSAKLLFSLSGLISVGECLFVLLFFPYITSLGVREYIYLPVIALSIAAAIFAMPFLYDIINSTRILPTGKYHLPLIAGTLGLSFCLAALFCVNPEYGAAAKAVVLFFTFTFTLVFYFVYTYVCSSIGSRLTPSYAGNEKALFSFAGAACFCLLFVFTQKLSAFPYLSAAAVAACVIALAGFSVYLATYKFMPRFIKLKEARKRGFKLVMGRFFSSFSSKENRRAYINLFLCAAAYFSLALCFFGLTDEFGLGQVGAAVAVITFFAAHWLITILTSRRGLGNYAKIAALILAVVFCAVVLAGMYINMPDILKKALYFCLPVFAGLSGGFNFSRSAGELSEVKKRSGATTGIIMNMKNIILAAAYLLALTAVSVAQYLKAFALTGIICFFLTALIAAAFVSFAKKRYLTLEIPDENV